MPKTTLTARHLLTGDTILDHPVLTLEDGRITSIHSDPTTNATGTLAPAFLDIHTHGAIGHDVMSATPAALAEMQRFLAQHGVAHYLPTTVTAPIDATLRALENLAIAIEATTSPNEAHPIGIHLEGPFLSHAKRGVHPTDHLLNPTPQLLDRFHAAARGHITLLTIAPELPGALETIAHARTLGIRSSLGHSNALAAETLAAIDAGATSATHTFNAMRPLDHREPGILGIALDDPRLFAELICDGIHVAPPLVRLFYRAKGPTRAILITDAMSAAGMPDGPYTLGNLHVTVQNGVALLTDDLAHCKQTLAGSLLTLDRALANFAAFTDTPIPTAARLATTNPATLLGREDLTTLTPGSPANLIHLDDQGRLLSTHLQGQKIS